MHFWIIYNGKILDFASQQFKNSFYENDLNLKMSKSYLYGCCDNYVIVSEYNIDNEWVRKEFDNWMNPLHEDYISFY